MLVKAQIAYKLLEASKALGEAARACIELGDDALYTQVWNKKSEIEELIDGIFKE